MRAAMRRTEARSREDRGVRRDALRLMPMALSAGLLVVGCALQAANEPGEFVQWVKADRPEYPFLADDRTNEESRKIAKDYFSPLIPEKVIKGQKDELRFRIMPRAKGWAGIMVLDKTGKPLGAKAAKVTLQEAGTDKTGAWNQCDQEFLFTDVSRVFPKTILRVTKGTNIIDEAVVDFSEWTYPASDIQMTDLMDGPTSKHGLVTVRDGKFWRDGKPIFFWGGHENHVPSKETTDAYCEVYPEAGLNLMRHIGIEETILKDPVTGELDKEQLDNYHYLVAKLGERGIYFLISHFFGYLENRGMMYGYSKEEMKDAGINIWLDPKIQAGWKKFLYNLFTAVNPYNGKALKDDPTVVGFELSNETGLNYRRFDYNDLADPKGAAQWRTAFNQFLLKKYGSREALARAWETDPLRSWEDPAKATILLPSNYRGSRTDYGGTGQHDQFTIGSYYRHGLPAFANPRIVDAIAFHKKHGPKNPGPDFDYNNPTTPKETEEWRVKWNQFLLEKYGDHAALAKAWAEDPLFKPENPTNNTILIPTNYRLEGEYQEDLTSRIANPRVSDAKEFIYQVQKEWATDIANFLKNEVGLKCGIGWNGDSFQVDQPPCHKANMDSPLDIAIHAAYYDQDNGNQITSRLKNLKRFNTYGPIYGRTSHAYEWGCRPRETPYTAEYTLLAGLMGRVYGFDGYSHHKMGPFKYPISDPLFSMSTYIIPLTDRRRGSFQVVSWILKRSRIPETGQKFLIGYPDHSAFIGGPLRRMCNPAFENWLLYQFGGESYSFKDVYDGPTNRVVIHSGHGPYGDYRKAQHAILWCHSNSDREGKDPKAKEKWFALHGITFKPGEKYYLDDHYFATTEDMTEYQVVHRKAEQARWDLLEENKKKFKEMVAQYKDQHLHPNLISAIRRAEGDYWAPEKDQKITELDHQLYNALKQWGYSLPFEENEIDKVWRSLDRSMEMDTTKLAFSADRDDMQLWFGKLADQGGKIRLSKLEIDSSEPQYCGALLPWDTADFKTSKTLAFWTYWNSQVTVKLPFPKEPQIYAVNWLGKRLYKVKPVAVTKESVTFMTCRHDDIFCYEIVR